MFSRNYFLGACAVMMFALIAIIPVSAQFVNPDVDDVLDNPQAYVGKEVTLEGEVDNVYNDRTFAMEDDADIFGEDHILVISVWPNVIVSDLDRKMDVAISNLKEGKVVRASGTIRMFDRAALESDFGALVLGDVPAKFDSSEPVLILGAKEYMASKVTSAELTFEQAPVEPVPSEVPSEIDTDTDAEPVDTVEPVEEPVDTEMDTEVDTDVDTEEEPARLPTTATGLHLIGLVGLASMTLGLIRRRR